LSDKAVNYYIAQSGLVSVEQDSAPTHNAIYEAEKFIYKLSEGESEIQIPLYWVGENGEKVTKTFIFKRGDYTINVNHSVIAGKKEWSGSQYMQFVRASTASEGNSMIARSYSGGVIFNDEIKYEKYDYDDMEEENLKRELDSSKKRERTLIRRGGQKIKEALRRVYSR
jgi:YidC/Oxa1 family membrane protein insertase